MGVRVGLAEFLEKVSKLKKRAEKVEALRVNETSGEIIVTPQNFLGDGGIVLAPPAINLRGFFQVNKWPVEYNPVNQMVLSELLAFEGAHVTMSDSGVAVVAELKERGSTAFDVVLMDCHMPEIDGYEVTRRVRAAGGVNRSTPIVALSASAFTDDRQRATDSGMNDFAPKPIELSGLRTVLTLWIPGFQPTGPQMDQQRHE